MPFGEALELRSHANVRHVRKQLRNKVLKRTVPSAVVFECHRPVAERTLRHASAGEHDATEMTRVLLDALEGAQDRFSWAFKSLEEPVATSHQQASDPVRFIVPHGRMKDVGEVLKRNVRPESADVDELMHLDAIATRD